MTRCHEIRPYLEAFVDDELSTDNALRVREHLGSCRYCAEEVYLTRALKRTVRDVVLEDARPSPEFMARLSQVLADESKRQAQTETRTPWQRRVVPMAMAAAALAALSFSDAGWLKQGWLGRFGAAQASAETQDSTAGTLTASINPQNIIDQLVHYHQVPIEPEVTDRSALLRFEPQVGVPMRVPELQQYGARFLGASIVPVERSRAVSLRYHLGEHRVTVYLFNPQTVPVRSVQDLQLRVIGGRPIFVGMRNGYSIAALEQRGVGYMIATDLDDLESAELLASIR